MNLRKRLTITFITLTLLPIVLTVLAFVLIAGILFYEPSDTPGPFFGKYKISMDAIPPITEISDEKYSEIKSVLKETPEKFEDKTYLTNLNKELGKKSSYLVVKTSAGYYFNGNERITQQIEEYLADYGNETEKLDTTTLFLRERKLVKQMDFSFRDGNEASLFVITDLNHMVSSHLMWQMFFVIIVILLATSLFLTRWINKGVFYPIRQLNHAMKDIADGNFDTVLKTDERGGEIGQLYKSYEDMRLKLKESTEEKIQNEKDNRELVSNITHDLKTPITSIKGYVEGIMDGVADTPEKMDKYIRTIYTKANDMDRLINELNYYSGIDSNKVSYHFQPINVADFFEDCVEEIGLDLDNRNMELNYTNLLNPGTKIIADPEQMKKVINNIIGNSVKYIDKEKGIIDIRLLDEIDSVRVEIEDNGKGISPKDLGQIFERFFRTDASRNSSKGGSGIGLSIVKKIIEDHGGYIWATSKEKEGTCMHFVIRKYMEEQNNE